MKKTINNILNLVYPPVCGFCGNICKDYICKKCYIKIKKYEIKNKANYNIKNMYFGETFHFYKYEEIVRDAIIDYKFNNKPYLYKTFSKIILNNKKICGILKKYDIVYLKLIKNKQ